MGTVNIGLSEEDAAVLSDLAKERGTAGETILAGVLHDFLRHQAVQMESRRQGTALSAAGEFAPEAEIAARYGSNGAGANWGRRRDG